MSEDATEGAKPDERDEAVLVYDFFKFLTTLALLVLGGVLTLASSNKDIPARDFLVVIIMVAIAGVAALSGAGGVVRARQSGQALARSTMWMQQLSMGFLGAGLGSFLLTWLNEFR